MKPRVFQNRGSIRIVKMANGNTVWRREDTRLNMQKIHDYLWDDFNTVGKKRKMTYAQLSRAIKMLPRSVSNSCWVMAFMEEPLVKIWAEKTIPKSKGQKPFTRMRVRLR